MASVFASRWPGGNYQTIVAFQFEFQVAFIKFIGSHADIRPIRNDDDLTVALRAVEELWHSKPGTPDGDRMEVLVTLIQAYENEHYAIPDPDPIDMIIYAMETKGYAQKDFAALLGS
jgi:antitoxin component HigA of HigAB toxin-antitoxin module